MVQRGSDSIGDFGTFLPALLCAGFIRKTMFGELCGNHLEALQAANCGQSYTDTCSGAVPAEELSGLQETLDYVRMGDALVVWSPDRLTRNLKELAHGPAGPGASIMSSCRSTCATPLARSCTLWNTIS